jgi:hypothetical protein
MDLLSTGDGSGRVDTSGVDPHIAEGHAQRMFWAVVNVNFKECRRIHNELNGDGAMYQLALDLFKRMCKQHGQERAGKWREYCE